MTTGEGDTLQQRYIGTMRLILTDDSDVDHSYDISNCIYDPNSLVNIVGIPVLEKYFNEAAEGLDAVVEYDGNTILSSGCRSHFKWDHGKHSRHFNHPDSQLPELCLYQGTGYFQPFSRDYKVHATTNFTSLFRLPTHWILPRLLSLMMNYARNRIQRTTRPGSLQCGIHPQPRKNRLEIILLNILNLG